MIAPVAQPTTALRVAIIAGLGLLLIGFASVVWTPYPIEAANIGEALVDPSGSHWLGTDHLGRDVLSLTMRSLLTSLIVGGVAVALSAIIGVPLGFAAQRWRAADWLRRAIDRFLIGLPAILVAMVLVAALGPGSGVLMLALGVCGAPAFARTTALVLARLEGFDFVASGRLAGLSGSEIWRRHLMPDFFRIMLATGLALLGPNILLEAALSCIGLGTQPPASSFGLLLRNAQTMAMGKPLLLIVPGLCLVVLAGLAAAASAGVRRLADPRLAEPLLMAEDRRAA